MNDLELANLKEALAYNPQTGHFIWIVRPNVRVPLGSPAGRIDSRGYLQITFRKKAYLAHRLAWAFTNGPLTSKIIIDHIDRNQMNNKLSNLREATKQQNVWNSGAKQTSKSGHKGVVWHKAVGKWYASIHRNGRQEYLGVFPNLEDAVAAYEGAAKETHGEFYYRGQ